MKKKKTHPIVVKEEGGPSILPFVYDGSDGSVASSEGWVYSIRDAALRQLELQPQYRSLLGQGWIGNPSVSMCAYYMANMAVGLADGSYRQSTNVHDIIGNDGTVRPVMSAFAAFIEDYRPMIYVDVERWINEG